MRTIPVFSDTRFTRQNVLRFFITGLLGIYFCILMHIPLFNLGGYDAVNLPQNTLAWIVATIVITGVVGLASELPGQTTLPFRLFFVGVCLLTLPILWERNMAWGIQALPRLAGLWGAVAFYYFLLRFSLPAQHKRLLLWCITFSAILEGVNVALGIFYPAMLSEVARSFLDGNGRGGLGIFQQVNVTASFLATGLALIQAIYSAEFLVNRDEKREGGFRKTRLCYLLAGMFFLTIILVLTKSRIGWLGGGVVFLAATIIPMVEMARGRRISLPCYSAMIIASLLGVMTGLLLLDETVAQAVQHAGSNTQRMLTLQVTWEMIQMHPWQGWGLGSFLDQFQRFIALHHVPNPSHELMEHPHNELLYTWMEGGIIAFCGFMLLAVAGLILLRLNRTYPQLLIWVSLLPVTLHTMVEFPLYYSTAHVLTLLVIILNLSPSAVPEAGSSLPPDAKKSQTPLLIFRTVAILLCACIIFWLVSAMRAGFILSHFEEQKLPGPEKIRNLYVPWLIQPRLEYDLITLNLVEYPYWHDASLLDDFLFRNARWLQNHASPDGYANQLDVLRYLHRHNEAQHYAEEACRLFPWDERFNQPGGVSCQR